MNAEIEILIGEAENIPDGIYDATDIPYIEINEPRYSRSHPEYNRKGNLDEVKQFIEENPNFVVANAYETSTTILFAKIPPDFTGKHIGSGFNYGSTNLLTDCPKAILILAEDD